jgi:hypothetical protein
MPRNSSGVYTLPAGNPVTTRTIIESSWANNTMSDIANEITESLARNGAGGMTGPMKATDGTAAAPSITFGSETSTGLYRVSSGQLGITTGGVQRFNISSSGSTFSVPVTVNGNLTVSGTISGNGSSITSINASNITSGTLADARLSSNVALKNTINTFTADVAVNAGPNNGLSINASTTAQLWINCTGAPVDQGKWLVYTDWHSFKIRTYSDDSSSGSYAFTIMRTGATAHEIYTYHNLYVGANQSNIGLSGLVIGDSSHSGMVVFHSPSNVRVGYIGNATTYGTGDNGTLPYVAGIHAFTGAMTVSDDLAPGRLISYTKYTNGASGNYTTPANARLLVVQMVGGGGGGGPGGPYAGGGGGGSGGAALIVIRNPSGNYAYSAGTGGGSGSSGTASSFAGLQSGGGQGGGNNGHPGAAGSNSGTFSGAGTLVLFESLASSSGGSGSARNDSATVAGEGGPSCFSFGGQPGSPGVNSNGNSGGPGGGGGGGVGTGSGGSGGYGEIRVFAYA